MFLVRFGHALLLIFRKFGSEERAAEIKWAAAAASAARLLVILQREREREREREGEREKEGERESGSCSPMSLESFHLSFCGPAGNAERGKRVGKVWPSLNRLESVCMCVCVCRCVCECTCV